MLKVQVQENVKAVNVVGKINTAGFREVEGPSNTRLNRHMHYATFPQHQQRNG